MYFMKGETKDKTKGKTNNKKGSKRCLDYLAEKDIAISRE
jgi:hypothetical protein